MGEPSEVWTHAPAARHSNDVSQGGKARYPNELMSACRGDDVSQGGKAHVPASVLPRLPPRAPAASCVCKTQHITKKQTARVRTPAPAGGRQSMHDQAVQVAQYRI